MSKIFRIFLILFLFSANNSFASKISLSTVVVEFDPDQNNKFVDVVVNNISEDEKAYVQITTKEILNPGEKEEKRVEVKKGDKNSLIVSPQKLLIEPKGRKNIRFVNLNEGLDRDRIYRVNVAPVVGKVESKSKTFIKILIAYDVLVIVRPAQPKYEFTAKREGNKVTFVNEGNTNVLFRKAEQCPEDKTKECVNIPGHRLYAGTTFTQELPLSGKVTYTFSRGSKLETVTY